MKIELEYNLKATIYHVDIDRGWLGIDFNNPILWVDRLGKIQKMQTIFFGWNYESEDDLEKFKEIITNILQNSYSDEEMAEVLPIADKRIRTLKEMYPNLNEVTDKNVILEVIKAIRLAVVERML